MLVLAMFNMFLKVDTFPKRWACANLVPLFKWVGSMLDPSSYRPIRLTDVVGKLYCECVWVSVSTRGMSRLSELQAGFRAGRSTMDHLFVLVNTIVAA